MSVRGEKEIKNCPICGKEFEALVSQHRKYCSKECHNKSKQTCILSKASTDKRSILIKLASSQS